MACSSHLILKDYLQGIQTTKQQDNALIQEMEWVLSSTVLEDPVQMLFTNVITAIYKLFLDAKSDAQKSKESWKKNWECLLHEDYPDTYLSFMIYTDTGDLKL